MEDKCGRQGDKSVNSCAGHPDYKTRGKQVGDKCQIMRPKTPRVKDKCGRQVEEECKLRPKAPKCEGQVGEKCKM